MSRPITHRHCAGRARSASLGVAALLLLAAEAAGAAPVDTTLYPPASQFRSLQLTALACGRDNDGASCDKARAMADPLLDHPRLSATCKDTLWAIRQSAIVAPTNSLQRRDQIDRPAKDVTIFCREPNKPAASGQGKSGQGSGGSGGGSLFNLQPKP